MKYRLVLLTACFLGQVSVQCVLAGEREGAQTAARLNTQITVQMNYLVYLPKDYDQQASWPLLLCLHGSGERGSDLEIVKRHGPPMLIAAGKEFPFIVVSPQCALERSWEPIELVALLDELGRTYKIDPDRVWLTGFSMGGYGTFRLAAYAPERFAAIVPICGGGETHWAKRIAPIPTWAFHGAKDESVPLERSQSMIDAINKKDGHAKLTIYPETDHLSWVEAYEDPELYAWLMAQRRNPQANQKDASQ